MPDKYLILIGLFLLALMVGWAMVPIYLDRELESMPLIVHFDIDSMSVDHYGFIELTEPIELNIVIRGDTVEILQVIRR